MSLRLRMREPFPDLPRPVRIYIIFIVLIYLAVATVGFNPRNPLAVVLLIPIFAATGMIKPVVNPFGGISDPNTGLHIVASLLWAPSEVVLGVGLGSFIGLLLFRRNEIWRAAINGAGWGLPAGAAAFVAHRIIADFPTGLISLTIAGLVAVATHRIINTGIFAVYRSWRFGRPILSDWFQSIEANWSSQLLSAPLAVALAAVSARTGTLESRLLLTAAYAIALPIARQEYAYYNRSREMLDETVEAMVRALEGVDPGARAHGDRVSTLAVETGRRLRMPERALLALRLASRLHDVGLLARSEGESKEEHHATVGGRILARFPDPMIAKIVRAHHERWDGKGLPDQLRGNAIPLGARILAAAEIYDSAMAGLPPFEAPLTKQAAFSHLISLAGTVLDPRAVIALLAIASQQEAEASTVG